MIKRKGFHHTDIKIYNPGKSVLNINWQDEVGPWDKLNDNNFTLLHLKIPTEKIPEGKWELGYIGNQDKTNKNGSLKVIYPAYLKFEMLTEQEMKNKGLKTIHIKIENNKVSLLVGKKKSKEIKMRYLNYTTVNNYASSHLGGKKLRKYNEDDLKYIKEYARTHYKKRKLLDKGILLKTRVNTKHADTKKVNTLKKSNT